VKHLWEKTHIHNTDRKDEKNKERKRHRDRDRDIFTERLMIDDQIKNLTYLSC
jgi:hypothetical protein